MGRNQREINYKHDKEKNRKMGSMWTNGGKNTVSRNKGKAVPLQAWTGREGSRRLRLPDFKTIGT